MLKNINLKIISNTVVIYMLLAFMWWALLLHRKNNDAFAAKAELMSIKLKAEGIVTTTEQLLAQPQYLLLKSKYDHQEAMIYGEGLVFILSLLFGIYMINLGHKSKVDGEMQTRNFLLSITHELKSPLTSIRLAMETIQKRDLDRENTIKLCNNGIQESDRLINLVNDLLLAAKVESSYQPLWERLDIQEKIDFAVQNYRHKYPEANIEWHPQKNSVFLKADKSGIQSVIDNLIDNALKYSFEDKHIKISLEDNETKVKFKIADNGIGISEENKRKIFEKFYRVGNEDTRRTKGTGLGLYIVNEIIKLHKGKITVSDNQPSGTVFTISLPKSVA
ncbi:MAG: sensor histidine kinase [Saprospiraceae bacterium]